MRRLRSPVSNTGWIHLRQSR